MVNKNPFNQFNKLWKLKKVNKPLIILIGGYCGTGKSTLAKKLHKLVIESNVVPTGVIRSSCSSFLGKKGEIFWCHTYDLYKYSKNEKELFENYLSQVKALQKPILNLCDFAKSEMQNFIIEGNHVFPNLKRMIAQAYCLDVFLKTDSELRLIKNMTATNHFRQMNENQIRTAIKLNMFTVETISKLEPLIDFNCQAKAIKHLENQLEKSLPVLSAV